MSSPEEFFAKCLKHIQERGESYASPEVNLERIARLWTEYLRCSVNAYDVSLMMVMIKISRLMHGYHQDSLEDGAAYFALAELLVKREKEVKS